MKAFSILLVSIILGTTATRAQNVRAHYANGQVWVVWDVQDAVLTNGVPAVVSNCLPATYAIYWSPNPVTNTTAATLVGRLFEQEWSGFILRDDVNASFGVRPTGFRIPDGAGGYRTLATNEGVFAHTVRSNFAGHYAVRPYDGLVTTTECLPPWTGDARGTWGGYFDWETNIVDTTTNWSAVLFLVGAASAFNPVEVCPEASRVVDVAIRRPQLFKPATGTPVEWELRNLANNHLLQSGTNTVGPDELVSIPNLTIARDPLRTRLIVRRLAPPPPPCTFPPTLFARLRTNSLIELRWEACDTNYQYQLEQSRNFSDWRNAAAPYAAPLGGGWLTNLVSITTNYVFYRVRADLLTNSPVPAAVGIYSNLLFTHEGILRSYRLMIPTNFNPAVSNAFALILHGHGQTAESFAAIHPALFFHAQTNGLILALPDSTDDDRGTGWNNFDPAPGEYQVNDVSFLLALIDRISATLNLDERRIYAGGFSSGAVMCHYLGARTTNVFAALAAVEASIGSDKGTGIIVTNPPAAGPMPIFLLNCTNSCVRPYYGGLSDDGALMTAAIDAAYYWTNANACAAAMTASTNNFVTNGMSRFKNCDNKPPPGVMQPNQVILRRWGNCSPGTEVVFVTLTDGGHTWPDRSDNLGFDANAEVPRFFLRHQRP